MSWKLGNDEWLAPPASAPARSPVDELDARVLAALGQDPVTPAPAPDAVAPATPPVDAYLLTSDDLPPPPYSAAFDDHDDAPPSYESGSFVADDDYGTDPAAASGEYPVEADEPDFHIPALSLSAVASANPDSEPPAEDPRLSSQAAGELTSRPSVAVGEPPRSGSSVVVRGPEATPAHAPGTAASAPPIAASVYDDEDEHEVVIPGLVGPATLEVELEPVASPLGYHPEASPVEPAPVAEAGFVIPTLARPDEPEAEPEPVFERQAPEPHEGDTDDDLRIPSPLLAVAAAPVDDEAPAGPHEGEVDGIESLDAADLEDEVEEVEEVEDAEYTDDVEPQAAAPAPEPSPPSEPRPPSPPEAPRRRKAWFDDVFAEHFLFLQPPTWEQTCERDAQFIHTLLGERQGLSILDVGCGDGRHAIELAKLGSRVTGLDNSLAMLLAAAQTREAAELDDGAVDFIHGDMRRLPRDREYDAVLCIGTTLGYFEEDQNWACLQEMCDRVTAGGRLLIHVFNRDFVAPHLPSRSWWQGKRCMVIDEAEMNFFANRLRVHRTVIFDDGRQFEHYMFMRAYTVQDLGKAISQLGMRVLEVSGSRDTRGRFYGSASPDIWIVAEKK